MLGTKLRARRKELGLSLRELGAKANLSAAFLSQVERGITNPSLDSLRRIAKALDVPFFYFFVEDSAKQPVVRKDQRVKVTLPGNPTVFELLTPDLSRKLEAFLGTVPPGSGSYVSQPNQPTEECMLVLQGKLEIQIDDQVYILNAGDSIYFDGMSLRSFAPVGSEPLVFLSAITPPML